MKINESALKNLPPSETKSSNFWVSDLDIDAITVVTFRLKFEESSSLEIPQFTINLLNLTMCQSYEKQNGRSFYL